MTKQETTDRVKTAPPTYRWVTCTQESDYMTSRKRHLLPLGASTGTTLCNSTGVGEGVWFANQSKPACPACEKVADRSTQVVIRPKQKARTTATA